MSIDLPPQRPMPAVRAQARQVRIEQYATPPTPARRKERLTRALVIATAASTVLIGGTATAYVAFRPASTPVEDQTRCYTKESLDGGDSDFYGTTVGKAHAADGSRAAAAAVDLCAALWQQGLLELGSKQVSEPGTGSTNRPVPPLVACTLDNGLAAVFPGDSDTCSRLGLPRLAE
ncbi:hypothetical protein [Polymorphospora rubra]|uniref:hypothetical protein n=1 Tax=Polymorphospora rubra TaxID=338584 RepID=UPI0033F0FFC7